MAFAREASEVSDIVRRLRLNFPVRLELLDPLSGAPYLFERENVLAALVIDAGNAVLESQVVAALYAEVARAHAAAKLDAARKLAELKRWKAQKRAECRRLAEKAKEKPPSRDLQDDFYREHADYARVNDEADRAAVLADLLSDLKEAFTMKQWGLRDIHSVVRGHDRVAGENDRSQDRSERLDEMASQRQMLDRAAEEGARLMAKRGNGAPAVSPAVPSAIDPGFAGEDDFDDDAVPESGEDVGEDEPATEVPQTPPPPPPPAPKAQSTKRPKRARGEAR